MHSYLVAAGDWVACVRAFDFMDYFFMTCRAPKFMNVDIFSRKGAPWMFLPLSLLVRWCSKSNADEPVRDERSEARTYVCMGRILTHLNALLYS